MSTLLPVFFLTLPATSATLTIAAASDLTDLEPKLASAFQHTHPGDDVRWVTSASGVLAQQIQNGAPYDIFMSANVRFVDELKRQGKIDPGVVVYAAGAVGLLWRDGKTHPLNDLRENWVKFVGVPNPKLAPYGTAAVQALQHEHLWEAVQPKVVYAENVRQALQLLESGNADAVLTSASLLVGRHAYVIPSAWHAPILQEAGIVAGTGNRQPAQAFLDFLKTPAARAVFAQYGLAQP